MSFCITIDSAARVTGENDTHQQAWGEKTLRLRAPLFCQQQRCWLALNKSPIDCDINALLSALMVEGLPSLYSRLGHFVGAYFDGKQLFIFRDQLNSTRLYYQSQGERDVISDDWQHSAFELGQFDPLGLAECLRYRTHPKQRSLYENLHALAVDHYWLCSPNRTLQAHNLHSYEPLNLVRQAYYSDKAAKQKIKQGIVEQYQRAARQHKRVAVLLSGGVDSFLLAALAKHVFDDVELYTPHWSEGKNPELARAKQFAQCLGLKHHVVHIDSKAMLHSIRRLLRQTGTLLRNFSSPVMDLLLEEIGKSHDLVIYGEYADTLFGSNIIRERLMAYQVKAHVVAMPLWLKKAIKATLPSLAARIQTYDKLDLRSLYHSIYFTTPPTRFKAALKALNAGELRPWDPLAFPIPESIESCFYYCQRTNLSIGIAHHMLEIEASAQHADVKVLTPFGSQQMLELSAKLSKSQYFGAGGDSLLANCIKDRQLTVKPLLRQLACEFAPTKLIFAKKYAFDVPMAHWLEKGLFSELKQLVKQGWLPLLPKLPYSQQDCEQLWTLLCLSLHVSMAKSKTKNEERRA